MPNSEEFSELIRTGGLDFALLKPIDTQFLISFRKVSWSSLANLLLGIIIIVLSLRQLVTRESTPWQLEPAIFLLYPLYILCGVAILYSLMTCLAATSVWLGRNQTLYDFWFYITNFSRYPQGFYRQSVGGEIIWFGFSFIVPILLVVTVPSRYILGKVLSPNWTVLIIAPAATLVLLLISRKIFVWSLSNYRSASS